DSIVVGTSTSRLLDPVALGRALGGRFASFAMPSMTAWEQVQVIDYFRRTVAAPRAVLIGLDHEWCSRNSNAKDREKEFPSWAYDENRWNDFLYLLNNPTLEVAGRTVGRLLGIMPEKLREDGFEVFVPPESTYDLARARYHIWGPEGPRAFGPPPPPLELSQVERNAMVFSTLEWLGRARGEHSRSGERLPVLDADHANGMRSDGEYVKTRETECKARIATIARRRGALLVDWRIVSPLTTEDSNFWDPAHYRLPIAYRLIDDLKHIADEGRESPDASYRILVR